LTKSAHADFGNSDPGGYPAGALTACVYQYFAKLAA
jgi:hypothetical protein